MSVQFPPPGGHSAPPPGNEKPTEKMTTRLAESSWFLKVPLIIAEIFLIPVFGLGIFLIKWCFLDKVRKSSGESPEEQAVTRAAQGVIIDDSGPGMGTRGFDEISSNPSSDDPSDYSEPFDSPPGLEGPPKSPPPFETEAVRQSSLADFKRVEGELEGCWGEVEAKLKECRGEAELEECWEDGGLDKALCLVIHPNFHREGFSISNKKENDEFIQEKGQDEFSQESFSCLIKDLDHYLELSDQELKDENFEEGQLFDRLEEVGPEMVFELLRGKENPLEYEYGISALKLILLAAHRSTTPDGQDRFVELLSACSNYMFSQAACSMDSFYKREEAAVEADKMSPKELSALREDRVLVLSQLEAFTEDFLKPLLFSVETPQESIDDLDTKLTLLKDYTSFGDGDEPMIFSPDHFKYVLNRSNCLGMKLVKQRGAPGGLEQIELEPDLVKGSSVDREPDRTAIATLTAAIQEGFQEGEMPRLNHAGKSGAYILKDADGNPIALFKVDSEDIGTLNNPKGQNRFNDQKYPGLYQGSGPFNEVLAYEFDRATRLPNDLRDSGVGVPLAFRASLQVTPGVDGTVRGTVMQWNPDLRTAYDFGNRYLFGDEVDLEADPPVWDKSSFQKLALFKLALGEADASKNRGNVTQAKGKAVCIDSGMSFRAAPDDTSIMCRFRVEDEEEEDPLDSIPNDLLRYCQRLNKAFSDKTFQALLTRMVKDEVAFLGPEIVEAKHEAFALMESRLDKMEGEASKVKSVEQMIENVTMSKG